MIFLKKSQQQKLLAKKCKVGKPKLTAFPQPQEPQA